MVDQAHAHPDRLIRPEAHRARLPAPPDPRHGGHRYCLAMSCLGRPADRSRLNHRADWPKVGGGPSSYPLWVQTRSQSPNVGRSKGSRRGKRSERPNAANEGPYSGAARADCSCTVWSAALMGAAGAFSGHLALRFASGVLRNRVQPAGESCLSPSRPPSVRTAAERPQETDRGQR